MTLFDRTPFPKPAEEGHRNNAQIMHYYWDTEQERWRTGYGAVVWSSEGQTTEHRCGDTGEPCVVYERKITVGRWKATHENGEKT